jgi:hypothetical protein
MRSAQPIDRLAATSRRFGRKEARKKLSLLENIAGAPIRSAKRIRILHDTLEFMRAYPDNADVLGAVQSLIRGLRSIVSEYTSGDPGHSALLNSGIPGTCNTYPYSYAILQALVRVFPGSLELDWDEIEDESMLVDALMLAVTPSETRGLEDEYTSLRDWLGNAKADPAQTDLELVLQRFRESSLDSQQQEHVFETCDLPIVYSLRKPGSGRCEIAASRGPISFQTRPVARERFPLRPRIKSPVGPYRRLAPRDGREALDRALAALVSRNLEIHPLINANPDDVTLVDGGRGVEVLLSGILPALRSAIESDFFFMIIKNGVPIAYGPVSIFLSCCEMGMNLFPEFRGGEIRYIYTQLMRALYHLAHVRYFFLVAYGMGEGNPAALKSGAFWFYRRLGFRAADPEVEWLARSEEAIMRRRPGYRSSMATLRELSYTEAYFDLSRGRYKPVDFGALGMAISGHIARHHGGNYNQAERKTAKRLIDVLEIGDYASWTKHEKAGMRFLSPLLDLIPGLESWPATERRALARLVKSKGGPSELDYAREAARFARFEHAIGEIILRYRGV